MNVLSIVKMFGAGYLERELADLLKKHVTKAGYANLEPFFADGQAGCAAADPDAVAGAIVHALFAIH